MFTKRILGGRIIVQSVIVNLLTSSEFVAETIIYESVMLNHASNCHEAFMQTSIYPK